MIFIVFHLYGLLEWSNEHCRFYILCWRNRSLSLYTGCGVMAVVMHISRWVC